jgi:2-octaprenyl-6-methoxyphenol hydroxylase
MRYRDLAGALAARLDAEQILAPARVEQIAAGHDSVIVSAAHGGATTTISARLVVHAEGTPGDDPGIRVHDYHQHAVIAEVEPREVHGGQAWERFTPDGPLALLPLGTGYALVYSAPPARAAELLRLDDAGFLSALRQQFGTRLDFVGCGARSAFPLARRVRTQLCAERQVWIGNAAQTLHPVSGQGFNLGLRDAWELAAALLADSARDPGDADLLAAYARARQLDRRGGAAFTDGIVRLFSNDIAPLRLARGLGLFALDALPPLRHFVAKRMIWGARAWP